MSKIFDVVERLILLDRLIKKEETGNAKEFASRLGISRSQLFNHIDKLNDLGVSIRYNKYDSSYEYFGDYELQVQQPLTVIKKNSDLKKTFGGTYSKSSSLLDSCLLNLLS